MWFSFHVSTVYYCNRHECINVCIVYVYVYVHLYVYVYVNVYVYVYVYILATSNFPLQKFDN